MIYIQREAWILIQYPLRELFYPAIFNASFLVAAFCVVIREKICNGKFQAPLFATWGTNEGFNVHPPKETSCSNPLIFLASKPTLITWQTTVGNRILITWQAKGLEVWSSFIGWGWCLINTWYYNQILFINL